MQTKHFAFTVVLLASLIAIPAINAQEPAPVVPGISAALTGTPVARPGFVAAVPAAYAPAMATSMGDDLYVDGSKQKCGGKCGKGCCTTGRCHHVALYADFLYLRARDVEVAYAVPYDGPVVAPTTIVAEDGPVRVADMDFQPGVRIGAAYFPSECAKLFVEYTTFESGSSDSLTVAAPRVIYPLASDPATASAGEPWLTASSQYDISFDIVDAAYERLIWYGCDYRVGGVLGIRMVQQEQNFQATFQGTGSDVITTDIDFYGAGLRFGLDAEYDITCRWQTYLKGFGSLIPGEFRADYVEQPNFGGANDVITGWKGGRLVSMWELELGLACVSKCRNYKIAAGYTFQAWTNMVQTDEWIRGVHTSNYIDMSDTSTFDGVVARIEARF